MNFIITDDFHIIEDDYEPSPPPPEHDFVVPFVSLSEMGSCSPRRSTDCTICESVEIQIMIEPCKHVAMCAECATHPTVLRCPQCNVEIQDRIRIFLPGR